MVVCEKKIGALHNTSLGVKVVGASAISFAGRDAAMGIRGVASAIGRPRVTANTPTLFLGVVCVSCSECVAFCEVYASREHFKLHGYRKLPCQMTQNIAKVGTHFILKCIFLDDLSNADT